VGEEPVRKLQPIRVIFGAILLAQLMATTVVHADGTPPAVTCSVEAREGLTRVGAWAVGSRATGASGLAASPADVAIEDFLGRVGGWASDAQSASRLRLAALAPADAADGC
jgi:hypothetical protein